MFAAAHRSVQRLFEPNQQHTDRSVHCIRTILDNFKEFRVNGLALTWL